jgi:hypothetical protein
MPLYYEGVGEVESNSPFVASVDAMKGNRNSEALLDAIDKAKASGATIAVIAMENPLGLLQTPNRTPKIASGLPVVLVPGSVAAELQSGEVKVRYSAEIVPGESINVIARFGDTSKKPILVATPLSGWFTCTAERGTGIAIALGLAQRLAPNHPVIVVGSPGHELLHHIGLQAYLEKNHPDAALVLHLGANLALGYKDSARGELRLSPGITDPAKIGDKGARTLFVRMDPDEFEALKPALAQGDLPAVLNPPLSGTVKVLGQRA